LFISRDFPAGPARSGKTNSDFQGIAWPIWHIS
jgi:hypothetical protein